MKQRVSTYLLVLLFLAVMPCLAQKEIQADSTAVKVTPDRIKYTVEVTVSDKKLKGKQFSVICYAPGVKGSWNDLTANKKYLLYMNQYTAKETTTFSFKVKKQPVEGVYTLVVSSERGQVTKQFRFIPEELKPTQTPAPTYDDKKTHDTPKPTQGNSNNDGKTKNISSDKNLKNEISKKGSKSLPAPEKVKAKSKAKKKIVITWKTVKGAKGYQISTSKKKNGKYKVKATIKSGRKKSAALKKLKSGKVYYVKIRAYGLSGKKKIAGTYSKAVKVKVR